MYINKLFLKEFGKFNNTEIKLDKGLNVICGDKGSGKSTIRDFVAAMLFGIDKTAGFSGRSGVWSARKPKDGGGYFGKAQITKDGREHLMERNFRRTTNGASLTDIASGKEERLAKGNSYRGVLYDMDGAAYADSMCIQPISDGQSDDKAEAERFALYLRNMKQTGCSGINRDAAIEYLENERKKYDNQKYLMQMEELEAQMDELGDVDGELEGIRQARKDELDSYNMEIARLKREARQLVNEADAAIPDEDEDRERSRIFLEVEAIPEEDDKEEQKKHKSLKDNIFVIMEVGIAVVAVVMVAVRLVGFQKSIQQLFTICTIAFVAITIIDGLFRKGTFDAGELPSEEEFKRTVYEMGRATESRTVRVEIDRAFQEEHDRKLDKLKFQEHDAVERRNAYYELKEKRDAVFVDYDELETEKKSIDEAINLIRGLSDEAADRFADINDLLSQMLSAISGGAYNEAKLDDDMHIAVKKDGHFFRAEFLGHAAFRQAYLAVRLCVAKIMNTDNLPLVIDDAISLADGVSAESLAAAVQLAGVEQTILLTSDSGLAEQFGTNTLSLQ